MEGRIPTPPVIEQHARQVVAGRPDVVGISLCYSQQVWAGLCLARVIRKLSKAPIILGGTFFNRQANVQWTLERSPDADFVIAGEGERPLGRLLERGLDATGLAGVYYRKDGRVVGLEMEPEKDLDSLGGPDYSDLDLRAYYSPSPVLPVLTSRGCYWHRCAFCVHYKSAGRTYRCRSVDKVVEELKAHAAAGVRHFAMVDEMISPARFAQLSEAILAAGLKIFYYASAKPVRQFDAPTLAAMYASGCRYLLWGVESGSQRVLDLMDKGTVVADVEEVLESAHRAGIRNHLFIMPGFPTETREEFQATMDLLARHREAIAAIHRDTFTLEKDSLVCDNPARYSISRLWPVGQAPDRDWCEFECSSGMSRQEVRQAFEQAVPFMARFGSFSPLLSYFRDHALLVYSRGT